MASRRPAASTTARGYGWAWQRLRLGILARDGWTCRYCGRALGPGTATVDHVLAKRFGGSDHPSNLAACCRPCQNRKGDQQPHPRLRRPSQQSRDW